jgi:hypothetical protein
MNTARKILPWFGIYVVVAFFVAFPVPYIGPRGEYRRALDAWQTNPTLQSEEAVHVQAHKVLIVHLLRSGIIALFFTSLGYGAYSCMRLTRNSSRFEENAS